MKEEIEKLVKPLFDFCREKKLPIIILTGVEENSSCLAMGGKHDALVEKVLGAMSQAEPFNNIIKDAILQSVIEKIGSISKEINETINSQTEKN